MRKHRAQHILGMLSLEPKACPIRQCSFKHIKKGTENQSPYFFMVGMTRLELATSRPPDACANQLRYIPLPFHYRFSGCKITYKI